MGDEINILQNIALISMCTAPSLGSTQGLKAITSKSSHVNLLLGSILLFNAASFG